ncbi:DUF4180 domain-containing protein [Paenibacillus faecalis]|uniref:DUF4180 domain-containing protein n=1 Tax=Paenibacillus faecalis TaxID=2079532 RepID=UPI000D10E076|nr:DUF4180 domain-containing protein [Paenibacillus faecalis]
MSINHAILGMLSYKPMTGYDLKKIIQASSFMYWSGNNNQIYKALLELHNEGLVTNEIYHQDSSPSKKIYTITNDGLQELKRWTLSESEIPEIKKPFLIQLAWTDQLSNREIDELLIRYEQTIKELVATEQERNRKGAFMPNRTPRESAIWNLIYENILSSYTNELEWINRVRQALHQFDDSDYGKKKENVQSMLTNTKEEDEMTYKVIEKNNQKYILLEAGGKPLQTEQDGLELISLCAVNGTNLLLIQGERLSADFMKLSTGVAGAILHKFTTYNIKAVVVMDSKNVKGRFKEFLSESNKGNMFRAYSDYAKAENWLLDHK